MMHEVKPHGGSLVNLLLDEDAAEALKEESGGFASITLSQRQLCDLELLLNGAFSPLTGFMTRAQYDPVVESMSLPDGILWPLPIVLDVPQAFAEKLTGGDRVALRQVRLGRAYDGTVEVLSGLDAGETIAADPVEAAIWLKEQGE